MGFRAHTTNGIEGYFGHLKNHLDLHGGIEFKKQNQFHQMVHLFIKQKMSFF